MEVGRREVIRGACLPILLSLPGCQGPVSDSCSEFDAVLELETTTNRVELPDEQSDRADELARALQSEGYTTDAFTKFSRGSTEEYVLEVYGEISTADLRARLTEQEITGYRIEAWQTGEHTFENINGGFRLPTSESILKKRLDVLRDHAKRIDYDVPQVDAAKRALRIRESRVPNIEAAHEQLQALFVPAGELRVQLASPSIPDENTFDPRFVSHVDEDRIKDAEITFERSGGAGYEVQIRWGSANRYTAQVFGLLGSSVTDPPDPNDSTVVTSIDGRKIAERPLRSAEKTVLENVGNPDYPPDDEYPDLPIRIPDLTPRQAVAYSAAILHPTVQRNTFDRACR